MAVPNPNNPKHGDMKLYMRAQVEALALTDVYDGLDGLQDWIARLCARPAYQRAKPQERMRDLLP